MAYIGQGIKNGTFAKLDTSGNTYNGSNVTFALGTQVGSPVQLLVSHDGVIQNPGTDYTLASNGTQITFSTAPASGASIFIMEISGAVGGPMNRDLNGTELILDADGDTSITADTDDQIDIKIAGDDDFTFTASTLTVNSTNKICFNDASQSIQGASATVLDINATDEIELNATAIDLNGTLDVSGTLTVGGVTSLPDGASGAGNLSILNTGDTDTGLYFPAANTISFECGAESLRIAEQKLSTNAETAPDVSSGGLTLDLNAADANVLTLKSSDVAHGITDTAETDTFFKIGKNNSTLGGAEITAFSEDIKAIELGAMVGAVHTTKSTSGELAINARARLKSGTGGVDMSSNANLFGVSNRNTTVMIVDTEGEIHSDGGAQSAYDTYEDAQLVRAYDLSHGRGVIDSKFDKFISYNHEKLAEMKLVGREEDGTPNHFVNVTGMQRLHNGAIWQQYEKHNQLLEAVYDLAKEAVGEEKANAILDKHEVKRLN